MRARSSLRKSRDFQRVRAQGRRLTRGCVVAVVARRPDAGPARVGITVARRCGGAVARNRIKRRLRAACATAGLPPGIDLVLHGRSEAAGAPFQELADTVREATATFGGEV